MAKLTLGHVVQQTFDLIRELPESEQSLAVNAVLAMLGKPARGEPEKQEQNDPRAPKSRVSAVPLAKFISELSAGDQPAKRFLATAQWLHTRGKDNLALKDVTTAISEAKQKRLSNPSAFFSTNVQSGFIEGKTKDFYVTDDGRAALGIKE